MNAIQEVSQPRLPEEVRRPARHAWWVRVLRTVASVALALAVLLVGLPAAVGTTVTTVGQTLGTVSVWTVMALTGLWMAGIFVHSFVLTGALPGLRRRQALTLNLTGSAVANVLPFGGATAMALNHHMIRTWGMSGVAFASYTLVTNVWVVLMKLVLPPVALLALLVGGVRISPRTTAVAASASAAFLCLLAGLVVLVLSRPAAERASTVVGRVSAAVLRAARRSADAARIAATLLACRDTVASVVRQRSGQLTAGMLGYAALQAVLMGACLVAVGLPASIPIVLAAFAAERILTVAAITPGGLGVAELGATATLVALGLAPAPATAAVLLYRAFTFAAEIPVGGVWLAGWVVMRRHAAASSTRAVRP